MTVACRLFLDWFTDNTKGLLPENSIAVWNLIIWTDWLLKRNGEGTVTSDQRARTSRYNVEKNDRIEVTKSIKCIDEFCFAPLQPIRVFSVSYFTSLLMRITFQMFTKQIDSNAIKDSLKVGVRRLISACLIKRFCRLFQVFFSVSQGKARKLRPNEELKMIIAGATLYIRNISPHSSRRLHTARISNHLNIDLPQNRIKKF